MFTILPAMSFLNISLVLSFMQKKYKHIASDNTSLQNSMSLIYYSSNL